MEWVAVSVGYGLTLATWAAYAVWTRRGAR